MAQVIEIIYNVNVRVTVKEDFVKNAKMDISSLNKNV